MTEKRDKAGRRPCAHHGCDIMVSTRMRSNVCQFHTHSYICNCKKCAMAAGFDEPSEPTYREPSMPVPPWEA